MFVEHGWMSDRPAERREFERGLGNIIKFFVEKTHASPDGDKRECLAFTVFAKGGAFVLPPPGAHLVVHGDTRGQEWDGKIYNEYVATAIYVYGDDGIPRLHQQPDPAEQPQAEEPPPDDDEDDDPDDETPGLTEEECPF